MLDDAYVDHEYCVLLRKMILEQVLYQIPISTSLL